MARALLAALAASFVLATKVYFPVGDGPNDQGLSRKHVFEQCHASLHRLGVDYIDLYQCHRYDDETPLEETCGIMNDLVRQGKVLYWGVSEWTANEIRRAVELCRERGWALPSSDQPEYNALQRKIEGDVLPTTRELGLGNVVWSPLAQGVLTGKYRPGQEPPADSRAASEKMNWAMEDFFNDRVIEATERLRPIAEGLGITLAQLALAWVLREPNVASAIVGASRPEQVEDNAAASGVELDASTLEAIDEALGDTIVR